MIRLIYALLFLFCFGCLMTAVGYWAGNQHAPEPIDNTLLLDQYRRAVDAAQTLAAGSDVPTLNFKGWINDDSNEQTGEDCNVLVIDIVGEACYRYAESLPRLAKLEKSLQEQGVQLVSLYPGSRERAETVRSTMGITWPIGYEALEAIAKLGALAPSEYVPNGGIAANPVFYVVVGSKVSICDENSAVTSITGGEVTYCDDGARTGHSPGAPRDLETVFQRVHTAVEAALASKESIAAPQE